jgi:hypothetical protein
MFEQSNRILRRAEKVARDRPHPEVLDHATALPWNFGYLLLGINTTVEAALLVLPFVKSRTADPVLAGEIPGLRSLQ